MRKISLIIVLLFASIISSVAQVTGVKSIPTDYPTLAAAIADLNTNGVGAGGATINLTQVETAPTGGYILGSAVLNASTSAANPLVINGGNNLITAWPTGINTTADAVFILAGTDYVTLNQLNIAENAANTTTTTQMERGIALMNFSSTDACNFCTVQNCTVNLNGATQIGTLEVGILVSQQLYTATLTYTTLTTPTAQTGVFDNIVIKSNTLQNCYTGIAATASSSTTLVNTNVIIGGTSAADGNTITGFASTTSGTTTVGNGIYTNYVGGNYVSNNTITGTLVYSSSTYGIYDYYSPGKSVVSKNTISLTSPAASTNIMYGIYHYNFNSIANSERTDSNTVQNVTIGGTGTFYGIYQYLYYSVGASPYFYNRNNVVNNITRNGLSGTTYGNYQYNYTYSSPAVDKQYLNNTVSNFNFLTMGGSGTIYACYSAGYSGGTVKGNVATNININNGASTTAQTIYGLTLYNYSGSASNNFLADSNEVSNISFTGAAATIYSSYIYNSSTINTMTVSRNKITNIGITGGGTNSNVEGAYIPTNSGTALYFTNNQISNLYSTAGAVDNSIKGIDWVGGTASSNFIYNNTINIGASSLLTSTGTNFGVCGLAFTVPINVKNNIIRVNATANGTGYATAVRGIFAGTAGTVSSNFAAGSGNNILYVPTAANAYLYAECALNTAPLVAYNLTNDAAFNTSCGLFKAVAGTRASATFTEDNLTAISTGVYAPTGLSYAEKNAATLASVTTDYTGATRPALPDCGANEFAGTSNDASGPTITYTPITSATYCTTLPTLSATITDASSVNTTAGTKPRLYYKKSTEADAMVGNTSADNGWKYVEASNAVSPFTFTFNAALLTSAPVAGDVIQYFITAQDLATTPNVSSSVVAFASGYCPATVNLLAAGFPTLASPAINSMTILAPNITLGATGNPTNACLGGSSVLSATDTITKPGVFPTGYLGPYCTGTADDEIWRVQIVGTTLNNSSNCATTGGGAANGLPASTLKQYSNYTGTIAPITLTNGTTYTVNMDLSNCGTFAYSMGISLWIDLNRNGILETATERVYGSPATILGGLYTTAPGYTTTSFTFTMPTTGVVNGPTLMRFFAYESFAGNTHTPASSALYGEVEDYWVNLNTVNATTINSLPSSAFTWVPSASIATNPNRTVTASSINSATTYTVTAADAGGCTYTTTTTVSVATPVVATGVTGTTTYCSVTPNTSLTLTTSNGSTPINSIWTGGPVVTPSTAMCLSNAGFNGVYAPANWTTTQTNSNGTVNTTGSPANIVMTSSNNSSGNSGITDYNIIATCAGTISFNWNYTTTDGAAYDYPRYRVNAGTPVTFSGYNTSGTNTQSGTQSITVAAGDVIGLQAYSTDNGFGACTITISNFVAPYSANVVTGTTAVVNPPVGTTTYTVTAIDACGTTSSTTVAVTVNPTPTVVLTPGSTTVCSATAISETASGSSATSVYTWMPGTLTGATQSLAPTANTTYTVTATDGPCSATTTILLTVVPNPSVTSTSVTPTTPVCVGDSVQFNTIASSGVNGFFVSAIPFGAIATPSTGVTTLSNLGTATVALSSGTLDDGGWAGLTLPFTFNYLGNNFSNFTVSTNGFIYLGAGAPATYTGYGVTHPSASMQNTICAMHSDLDFRTAGVINYFTTGTAPNRKLVVNFSNGQYYSATGSLTTQLVLYETTNTIEVHTTSCTGTNVAVMGCDNATGTTSYLVPGRNATNWAISTPEGYRWTVPSVTYSWGPATNINNTTVSNPKVAPSVTSTYTVTVTNTFGCTATGTALANINPPVVGTLDATPDTICVGASSIVSGSIPMTCGGTATGFQAAYAPANWSNVNTNSNGTITTTAAPTSISMTSGTNTSGNSGNTNYSIAIGCAGTVSFNWAYSTPDFAIFDYPTYSLNGGASVIFPGYNTGGASTQNGTASITVAAGDVITLQAYTFDNDAYPCTVTISNFAAPAAPVTGTVSFWDAKTGGTSLGASPLTVTPGTTTKYYAQFTQTGTGCVNPNRDSISVTVNPLPNVTASVSATPICLGNSTTFTGGGASTYTWTDGTNTPTNATAFTPSTATTSTYTVTGTDANTCSATSTVSLTVNALPVVTASVSATPICLGNSTTFTGGGASTYTWTDGTNTPTDATTFTPSIATTSTYTVTGTDGNTCSATSTVSLTVNALPIVTASVSATPICLGAATTFTGGGATSYTWTDGTNTPTDATAFTPSASGTSTYTVTGTDANTCSATSTVSLTVNTVANFVSTLILNASCPNVNSGSALVTSAGGTPSIAYTIAPTGPAQPSSGIFTTMTGGTTYTVTLSDANSCTATTTLTATNPSNGGLANAAPANISSTPGTACQTQMQADGNLLSYYGATCDNLIATVNDGAGGNILGNVNACVTVLPTVPTYNGQPYLPRTYDIVPTNQGPATITLYFTQDDFDDYNAAAGSFPQIPAVPATGTVTFCISQVPQGFLPGAPGASTIVHTVTATWNATLNRWEVTFPVASFSGFYCHACNPMNVPLPASIADFKGSKTETSDMLTWSTTSELNNAYFNLLYSTNGKNYTKLGRIESKATNGYSNNVLNYSYEHTTPQLGHNYYKLEQVDIDGKSTSNTQIVDLMWNANGSTVSVYPNPTSDELNIDVFTTKVQNTSVKVLDMSGRIVKEVQTKSQIGANNIKLSLGELANGIYTVQVLENDKLTQVSKVKKN